jgi:GAF domain-containing protein
LNPLTNLILDLTNPRLSKEEKLKNVCKTTLKLVNGADRISLWTFDDEQTKIVSLMSYDQTTKEFSSGQELHKSDFSPYFESILKREIVSAPNARENQTTSCFTESYFKPLNIYSLLDYILHQDFQPKGVICCESVGRESEWQEEDIQTLRRIASSCSMYFNIERNSL